MNNQTFSIYENDSYDSVIFQSPLDQISVKEIKNDTLCYEIEDLR